MATINKTINGTNTVQVGACPLLPCQQPVFSGIAIGQIKITNNSGASIILLQGDEPCTEPPTNCITIATLIPGQNVIYTFIAGKCLHWRDASCGCGCSIAPSFNETVFDCDNLGTYTTTSGTFITQSSSGSIGINHKISVIIS